MAEPKKAATVKKRKKRQVVEGLVQIKASFNNTIITFTDLQGNTLSWSSSAKAGFKGSRKSTPFAAQVASAEVSKFCVENFGFKLAHVKVKGPGPGRESAVRAIEGTGIKILSIEDISGIPHNGCRDSKKRRV